MSNDTLEKFNPKNKSSFRESQSAGTVAADTIRASRYTKKAIDRSGISKKKKDIARVKTMMSKHKNEVSNA